VTFRDLSLAAALSVAHRMRQADIECLEAMLGACDPEAFAVNRYQTTGPAWAMYEGEMPVAILGLSVVNEWTLNAWLVATPGFSAHSGKKLLRFARTVRGNALQQVRRIECAVISTWGAAERFARALGFELEGVKRAAGKGGEDVLIFATRKDET
jgi:hypothetical protein